MCTKYNIGDVVWAFDVESDSPIKFVVDSINIDEDSVYYTLDNADILGYYLEKHVFETREECVVYYTRMFRRMSIADEA